MRAVIYNSQSGKWLEFSTQTDLLRAETPSEVPLVLEKTAQKTASEKLYAAGFIAYEASPGFDSHLKTFRTQSGLPVALFALFADCREYTNLSDIPPSPDSNAFGYSIGPFIPETADTMYFEKIAVIKEYLKNGDTYQVNYTWRLEASFSGKPFAWFCAIAESKPGEYLAYIESDDFAVCSFSPELFFRKNGRELVLKPMKGTVKRIMGKERESAAFLKRSEKNRAENLMIVDMIRSDAGRIAETGSVTVPSLFDIEVYPTVIQMTSTVTARTDEGIPEIFSALFPCASITGAPKVRSMEIIHELEASPRGLYTGAIGFITPEQNCLFNVAIRTAVIDKKRHTARYGTGGGIIWESEAHNEWEECMMKTALLGGDTGFYVFESMLLEDGEYFLPERHLARFEKSCIFFGIDPAIPASKRSLLETAALHPAGAYKVRMAADGKTQCLLDCAPLAPLPVPYTVTLARTRVDPGDPFLAHKTSRRRHIEEALAGLAGEADVILVNTREELTETSRANLVVQLDGTLYTPPLEAGLLPGVYREELLEKGMLKERVLHSADLRKAEKIFIINSVRKMIECRLM